MSQLTLLHNFRNKLFKTLQTKDNWEKNEIINLVLRTLNEVLLKELEKKDA